MAKGERKDGYYVFVYTRRNGTQWMRIRVVRNGIEYHVIGNDSPKPREIRASRKLCALANLSVKERKHGK